MTAVVLAASIVTLGCALLAASHTVAVLLYTLDFPNLGTDQTLEDQWWSTPSP